MIKIRRQVFETNSSSTHVMAIPKKMSEAYKKALKNKLLKLQFDFGYFGWDEDSSVDPASYLYTAIYEFYIDKNECEQQLDHLKEILDKYDIKYSFEKPVYDQKGHLKSGFIDHPDNLDNFLREILHNEDKLLRFLFEGIVFVGNDNMEDSMEEARHFEFEHKDEYDFYGKGN